MTLARASRRRLVLAGGALAALAPFARAQARVARIGWVAITPQSMLEPYSLEFKDRLKALGFVEGRNLEFAVHQLDGRLERTPAVIAELARRRHDLVFCGGTDVVPLELMRAGIRDPVLIVAVDYDPVAVGLVKDLARPGGRITGVTSQQSLLPAKRLELLRELLPAARTVAVFANAGTVGQLEVVRGAAQRLGLALHVVMFRELPYDFASAFHEIARAKVDALLVLGSGLFIPGRRRIPELAARQRIPTMFHQAQWAEAGGLLSYGFSFVEMYRRAAEQAALILRGTDPAQIPMEQAMSPELVINNKTAKAIGIPIPQAVQVRADRVID